MFVCFSVSIKLPEDLTKHSIQRGWGWATLGAVPLTQKNMSTIFSTIKKSASNKKSKYEKYVSVYEVFLFNFGFENMI